MVSHDRYFIERICNAIIEISPGYSGFSKCSYTQYQNRKITREIQLKKAWTEQQEFIKKTQSFIDKFRYNASKSKQVQSRIKSLEKIVPVELNLKPEIMGLRFPDPPKSGTTVINACGLSKSYGDLKVFEDIDFNIDRGEKIAVSGTNGAGKTSLLKILSGRLDYESGIIEFGHNVIKGYFAQHTLEELNPEMTIIETMEEAAPVDLIPDLRTLLGCFLFASDDINKKVSVLSGGEKSRLALAKLLMRPFNLLIIDEPTNHLDVDSRAVLAKALKRYEGTLIIVSHDRFFTDQIVNRVIHLEEGKLYNHLGNLSSFIEKQRLALEESIIKDNFSKCENSSRSSFLLKGGSKTDQGLSKTERAKKLKVEREKRVVKRKMLENFKVLENEIHNLEIEIEEIRYRQSLPEIYSDPEKAADLARQVNWLENQLEDKLLIWEESAQNIDML
jgi:ATP-binding cassette subfamily F protein 3